MYYYFSLGTNLGNREENLRNAYKHISDKIGRIIKYSAYYCTEPEGFVSKNKFLNSVILLESTLAPQEVLHDTQYIEKELGRTQKSVDGVYHDRIIDIDILLAFDKQWNPVSFHDDTLTIPHPRMMERAFVLMPLKEIAPHLVFQNHRT